jgi:hypothetical protein
MHLPGNSLEAGIFQLLTTTPELVALQGTNAFFLLIPEANQLPATTFRAAGGSGRQTLDSSGPQRRRFQFDFRATNGPDAIQLRDATRGKLDRFTGALPNGFVVTNILWCSSNNVDFDNDARNFRICEDYYINFNLP